MNFFYDVVFTFLINLDLCTISVFVFLIQIFFVYIYDFVSFFIAFIAWIFLVYIEHKQTNNAIKNNQYIKLNSNNTIL